MVIYNLTGNVYDILFDQELSNAFGVLYYYDNNNTLRRYRISGEDVSKNEKKIDLDEYLNQYYEKFKDDKSEIHDSNTITTDNQVLYLSNTIELYSEGEDFGSPIMILGGTDIYGAYSYVVHEHLVFRYTVGSNYIFRVESKVQFTSGNAAVESSFDNRYKSYYGLVSGELEKHIEYGYGTWYSAQPKKLDYRPKKEISYRTITSGFNINLTLGRTESIDADVGEDGYGISANSEFSSTLGFGYFYQETRTIQIPTMNAQWLSLTEGAAWEYTTFNNNPDVAVTVYPGMLFETIPAYPYAMRYNGEYHVNIEFVTRRYFLGIPVSTKTQALEEIIMLDVLI